LPVPVAYTTKKITIFAAMQQSVSPSNSALLSLSNRVARLLTQFFAEKAGLSELGLQPQHMGVLSDLWQKDGLRQQDLAIALIKDKATITRMLSYLEEQNVLVRIADKEDRRIKRIYLTHKGKSLGHQLMPKADQATQEATWNIDPGQLSICLQVLGQIYDNLNSCRRND
jgi:DNA-binding MarR family transcriptional regulator